MVEARQSMSSRSQEVAEIDEAEKFTTILDH